jgi:hypothetical protein
MSDLWIQNRFSHIDNCINGLTGICDSVLKRIEALESGLKEEVTFLDKHLDKVSQRTDSLEEVDKDFYTKINDIQTRLNGIVDCVLKKDGHEDRIIELEKQLSTCVHFTMIENLSNRLDANICALEEAFRKTESASDGGVHRYCCPKHDCLCP